MIIDNVVMDTDVELKIYKKHKVTSREIKITLKEDEPIFYKVGGEHYMVIGIYNRYLTIFFIYDNGTKTSYIRTAYPSSRWQIKLYKRKKWILRI